MWGHTSFNMIEYVKTRELFHDVNEWMMSVELRPNFKAGLYNGWTLWTLLGPQ
jgi:hypothetical protein